MISPEEVSALCVSVTQCGTLNTLPASKKPFSSKFRMPTKLNNYKALLKSPNWYFIRNEQRSFCKHLASQLWCISLSDLNVHIFTRLIIVLRKYFQIPSKSPLSCFHADSNVEAAVIGMIRKICRAAIMSFEGRVLDFRCSCSGLRKSNTTIVSTILTYCYHLLISSETFWSRFASFPDSSRILVARTWSPISTAQQGTSEQCYCFLLQKPSF